MIKGTEVEDAIDKSTDLLDLVKDDYGTDRAKFIVQNFVDKLNCADYELIVFTGELLRLSFQKKCINGTIAEVFRNPQMLTTQLTGYILKKYHFPCPADELRNFFEKCHELRNLQKLKNFFLNTNDCVINTLLPLYYEYITFSLGKIIKEKVLIENKPQLSFLFNEQAAKLEIQLQYTNQESNEKLLKNLSIQKKKLTKIFLKQVAFSFVESLAISLPGEGQEMNLVLSKEFQLLMKLDVMEGLATKLDEKFSTYNPTSFQDKLDEKKIIQWYNEAIIKYSCELKKLIHNCKTQCDSIKSNVQNLQAYFTPDSQGYRKLQRIIDEIDSPHQFNNSYHVNEFKGGIILNINAVLSIVNSNKELKNQTAEDVKAIKTILGLQKQKRISHGLIKSTFLEKYTENEHYDSQETEKIIPSMQKLSMKTFKKRSRIKSQPKKKQEVQKTFLINYERKKISDVPISPVIEPISPYSLKLPNNQI